MIYEGSYFDFHEKMFHCSLKRFKRCTPQNNEFFLIQSYKNHLKSHKFNFQIIHPLNYSYTKLFCRIIFLAQQNKNIAYIIGVNVDGVTRRNRMGGSGAIERGAKMMNGCWWGGGRMEEGN